MVWNSSGVVTESSSLGDVLHSLLGYADRPTVLQIIVWVAYIVVSMLIFIHLGRERAPKSGAPLTPRDTTHASKKTRQLPT